MSDPAAKNPRRWLIRIGLAVVVLAVFAYVGRRFFDDLPKLRQAKPLGVLLIALIFIPTRILTSEIMRLGLRALGHVVSAYESFMVSLVNAYANLLIPRAGLGLPAVYMKMKHGVRIADFSGVQLVPMTVLQITTIGLAGVIVMLILHAQGRATTTGVPLLPLFAALALGSLAAVLLPVGRPRQDPHRWQRSLLPARFRERATAFLSRMGAAYQQLGRCGHTIAWSMLLHAGVLVLRAARIHVAFWAMGQDVNFWGVFVGSLLADVAFFISVTPAALGFREGGVMLAAPLIGVTPDMAVATTILDRIVYSLVIVAIGQFGLWRLVHPVFARKPPAVAAESGPAVTVAS